MAFQLFNPVANYWMYHEISGVSNKIQLEKIEEMKWKTSKDISRTMIMN